ncbi:MAG TPA: DNA-binding protein [Methylomirabilota bacterium]|nr:DNA-binding protein [Methylomirabilota bacterium]
MRKLMVSLVALAAVVGVMASVAAAQPGPKWRGSGGWGPDGQYGRMFDAKAMETITGEIVKVDRVTPMRGMGAGVLVVVKTDKGEVPVHLGPAWFIENQDVKLAPKDTIEVKGARATFQGKPALIAAEVKKGEQTLRLRNESGVPVWAGWRRG